MRTTLILIALFLGLGSHAQHPQLVMNNLELVGAKYLHNDLLLISCTKKSNQLELILLDHSLKERWTKLITVKKLKGYHFNKVQVIAGDTSFYWIDQYDRAAELRAYSLSDGRFLYEQELSTALELESDPIILEQSASKLYYYEKQDTVMAQYEISAAGKVFIKEAAEVVRPFNTTSFSVLDQTEEAVLTSSYYVSSNHRSLHVEIKATGRQLTDTVAAHHHLELQASSFTYHSSIDQRLMSRFKAVDGYYMLGKLDHPFQGRYPKEKRTDAMIGMWVAKFNTENELEYFREIRYEEFEGLIPNNQISKPAVIAISEDLKGGLMITINEARTLVYGNKYIIGLDKAGKTTSFIGGRDAFHFFEYDQKGLRDNARKNHVRLINDDMSYYDNVNRHLIRFNNAIHSAEYGVISNLALKSDLLPSEQFYSVRDMGKHISVLQYLDRGRGRLHIYSIPKQ